MTTSLQEEQQQQPIASPTAVATMAATAVATTAPTTAVESVQQQQQPALAIEKATQSVNPPPEAVLEAATKQSAPAPAAIEEQQQQSTLPAIACCEAHNAKLMAEIRHLKANLAARDQTINILENKLRDVAKELERTQQVIDRQQQQQPQIVVVVQDKAQVAAQQEELSNEERKKKFAAAVEEQRRAFLAREGDSDDENTAAPRAGKKRPNDGAAKMPATKKRKPKKGLRKSDVNWNNRFAELAAYKEKHGDCHVSSCGRYRALGMWADIQRHNHKHMLTTGVAKGSMTDPEKMRRLLSIGFSFVKQRKPGNNQYPFEERFRQLAEFKAKMGHCNVSIAESSHDGDEWPKGLGHFVAEQRKHYNWIQTGAMGKQNPLDQNRIDQLNAIGFQWSLRGGSRRRRSKKQQQELCFPNEEEGSVDDSYF